MSEQATVNTDLINFGWKVRLDFVCRSCGTPSRLHPQTKHIWGCINCGYTTAAVYHFFKPVKKGESQP